MRSSHFHGPVKANANNTDNTPPTSSDDDNSQSVVMMPWPYKARLSGRNMTSQSIYISARWVPRL